jgi:DNA-binding transcriptional MerR regulator
MEALADADSTIAGPQDPLLELVYRVGAVARLANIPVETLRVWERRYGIVEHAGRRNRHRLYSVHDVRRLTLIKKLVDDGSSISSVARLPLADLQQMVGHATEVAPDDQPASPTRTDKVRLILVGPALQARFAAAAASLRSADVVAQGESLEVLGAVPVQADVLVIEVDTVQPELKAHVERALLGLGARVAIIAYRFAATEVLEELAVRGHMLYRAPLMIDVIDALCAVLPIKREAPTRQDAAFAELPPTPVARFDERTLARIASMPADLRCECPRHVTELLLSLSAFEKYSAQCANRCPQDAELHLHLGRIAAHCRQHFEQALIYVARAEGIPLT